MLGKPRQLRLAGFRGMQVALKRWSSPAIWAVRSSMACAAHSPRDRTGLTSAYTPPQRSGPYLLALSASGDGPVIVVAPLGP
jgi:hypothetical protein